MGDYEEFFLSPLQGEILIPFVNPPGLAPRANL
jgi:hypothetical protein